MELNCSIFEAATFDDALEVIERQSIDLLLLDLRMPGNDSLLGLMNLRIQHPQLAVVVVSASEDPEIICNIKEMGAMGFIPKSYKPQDMSAALSLVLEGSTAFPNIEAAQANGITRKLKLLTPQQLRVLQLVAQGDLNKQIAYALNIKETTVKTHISDIFKKLEINNRTQAALIVQELSPVD